MSGEEVNKVGRPTVMTPETIAKLEEAFSIGGTDIESCFFAGISVDALYDYQKLHPEFTKRKEALKSNINFIAKKNIAAAIKGGDEDQSKWHLERRDPEYNPKSNINLGGQQDNPLQHNHTVTFAKPNG